MHAIFFNFNTIPFLARKPNLQESYFIGKGLHYNEKQFLNKINVGQAMILLINSLNSKNSEEQICKKSSLHPNTEIMKET